MRSQPEYNQFVFLRSSFCNQVWLFYLMLFANVRLDLVRAPTAVDENYGQQSVSHPTSTAAYQLFFQFMGASVPGTLLFSVPLVSEKSKLPELKFHLSVVVLDHVGPQVVDAVFEARG